MANLPVRRAGLDLCRAVRNYQVGNGWMDGWSIGNLKGQNPRPRCACDFVHRLSGLARHATSCHAMPCHATAYCARCSSHLRASDARPRRESVHEGTMCALPSGTRRSSCCRLTGQRHLASASHKPVCTAVRPPCARSRDRHPPSSLTVTD